MAITQQLREIRSSEYSHQTQRTRLPHMRFNVIFPWLRLELGTDITTPIRLGPLTYLRAKYTSIGSRQPDVLATWGLFVHVSHMDYCIVNFNINAIWEIRKIDGFFLMGLEKFESDFLIRNWVCVVRRRQVGAHSKARQMYYIGDMLRHGTGSFWKS